jgi:hypothetical protein
MQPNRGKLHVRRREQSRKKPDLVSRIVALVVLVVLADLWFSRHLLFGLVNPGSLTTLLASASAAIALVRWLVPENQWESVEQLVRRLASRIKGRMIAGAYGALFLLASTCSSVTVEAETAVPAVRSLKLKAVRGWRSAEDSIGGEKHPRSHFLVFTPPLGRDFELIAETYIPTRITVYPLMGRTIKLGATVPPEPGVLFRPAASLVQFRDNGHFVVRHGRDTVVVEHRVRSFLVGPDQQIPTTLRQDWPLDITGEHAPLQQPAINSWRSPEHVEPRIPLRPGMSLIAEVLDVRTQVIGRAEITIGAERLTDVFIPA